MGPFILDESCSPHLHKLLHSIPTQLPLAICLSRKCEEGKGQHDFGLVCIVCYGSLQATVHSGLLLVLVSDVVRHPDGQVLRAHSCFFGPAVVRIDFFSGVIYPRRFSHAQVHGTGCVATAAESVQVWGFSRSAAPHVVQVHRQLQLRPSRGQS